MTGKTNGASDMNGGGSSATAVSSTPIQPADLARYIDHTLLKPEASEAQVATLCDEAAAYHFWSVCVNSHWVGYCARRLEGTGVRTCSVVGFPLGAMDRRAKGFEAATAVAEGAAEIDMVMNVGALKSGAYQAVREDISAVRKACPPGIILKVILETCLLTDEEKVLACRMARDEGADFVKTSTGFSKSGATVDDIALMRRTVGPSLGVKASGGIRTYGDAMAMIQAGATRLGASAGIAILSGMNGEGGY